MSELYASALIARELFYRWQIHFNVPFLAMKPAGGLSMSSSLKYQAVRDMEDLESARKNYSTFPMDLGKWSADLAHSVLV